MFSSRTFWKIYLSSVLFTLITVTIVGAFIIYELEPQEAFQTERLRLVIFAAIGVGATMALAFGLLLAHRVAAPLRQATEFAGSIAGGNYEEKITAAVVGKDEFGELENALNAISARIKRDTANRERAEAALGKAAQYENLFRLANDAILIFEPDTEIILEVSDKACEIYGRHREDFVGQSLKEMSQNVSRGSEELEKLLHDGVYDEFESVHLRGDGTMMDLVINAAVIEYHGKPAILTVNRDVTAKKQTEAELRASEERFRSVTRSAQDAIVSADSRGDVVFWNEGAEKIFGYTEDEVLGKSLQIIIPAAHRDAHQKGLERNVGTGENHLVGKTVEVPGRRRDGSEFPLELSLGAWESAKGKFFTAVLRDITERKLAENAVKESEQSYRLLGEGIMHQVWTSLPDGRLDYVNRRTLEYFGIEMEQAINDGWLNVVHPVDLPECIQRWTHSLLTGEDYEVRFRLKRADGEYRWHLGRATAGRDGEGKIIKWFGTNTDIHDRKLTEEALRRSETNLAAAQRIAHLGSWEIELTDLKRIKNNRVRWSDEVYRIFGHAPGQFDVSFDNYFDSIHPDDRKRVRRAFFEAVSRRKELNLEYRAVLPGGGERFHHGQGMVIGDEQSHQPLKFVGTVQDVTERKRVSDELQKNVSLLSSTFEATADGILVVSAENKIVAFNDKFARMWGMGAEELRSLDSADATERISSRIKKTGDYYEKMRRVDLRADDSTFDILELKDGRVFERYSQSQKLNDKISGRVFNFRDITARRQAESEKSKLAAIVESSIDAIISKNLDGVIESWNAGAERLFGYSAGEAVGRHISLLFPPERLGEETEIIENILAGKPIEQFETVRVRKDGARVPVSVTVSPIRNVAGGITGISKIAHDITARKRAEERLVESEYKHRTLIGSMSEGLVQVDNGEIIEFVNDRFCEMTGYSPDELLGKVTFDFIYDEAGREFVREANRRRAQGEAGQYELNLRKKSGEVLYVIVGGAPVLDAEGAVVGSMGVFTDITERKRAEEQLLHDAFHDALTGLANRKLFMEHLQMTIDRARRGGEELYAVLFLDFDGFKVVNDSLGHAEGDRLLLQIARRLESSLRPGDLVARLGGDEFTILLSRLDSEKEALQISGRIQENLKQPFELGGREVFISASIGIALGNSGGVNRAEDMLRDADIAMYRAKSKGKAQHQVFDRQMHEQAIKRLRLETEMRQAVERGEFCVFYQPIVDIETGGLVGFESLIRWQHPERGMIPPLDFIPAAEENNLILPIGKWILRESCRQLRRWQDDYPAAASDLTVSVNLSCKEFSQLDLAEQIAETLAAARLEPRCLKLEITESHVMENSETAAAMMNRLRLLGVQLSLDDFGTGYSSLSYLHRLPVNYLKIDRSFITRMAESLENEEIVRTIVKLAQNLKMQVIAEGVETAEQLTRLKQLKCEYGQGYFFSKPLAAEDAGALLCAAAEEAGDSLMFPKNDSTVNLELVG